MKKITMSQTMTPPRNLTEFEALVMADSYPAVCMIDRDLIRALLGYVRELEAVAGVARAGTGQANAGAAAGVARRLGGCQVGG